MIINRIDEASMPLVRERSTVQSCPAAPLKITNKHMSEFGAAAAAGELQEYDDFLCCRDEGVVMRGLALSLDLE